MPQRATRMVARMQHGVSDHAAQPTQPATLSHSASLPKRYFLRRVSLCLELIADSLEANGASQEVSAYSNTEVNL